MEAIDVQSTAFMITYKKTDWPMFAKLNDAMAHVREMLFTDVIWGLENGTQYYLIVRIPFMKKLSWIQRQAGILPTTIGVWVQAMADVPEEIAECVEQINGVTQQIMSINAKAVWNGLQNRIQCPK